LTITSLSAGLLFWAGAVWPASAQDPTTLSSLAVRFASLNAVTGYEQAAIDTVLRLLPDAGRDRGGNARLQLGGSGSSRRLVVCPLDEPGYVVGRVREDGYLTLRRVPGAVPPLFDQQIEGHRVAIQGVKGVVPGVVPVRSIHLTRGRQGAAETPFTVDDAFVDVGAKSLAEVHRLGIQVLSPVTLAKRPHRYGQGLLAGPVVGRRTACAALMLAVRQSRLQAKLLPPVTAAFAVQHQLSHRGLAALGNASGPFTETLIVDAGPGAFGGVVRGAAGDTVSWPGALGRVVQWSLPVRFAGTPVETVSLADADTMRAMVVRWIGGSE
jgi:putative aminopeptidase